MSISRLQLELLRQAFGRGLGDVKSAFQMIAGIPEDRVSAKAIACRPSEFHAKTGVGSGALAVVESNVHGDVEGDIMLLQTHADFQVFGRAIENAMLGISGTGDAEDLKPDWLEGRDHTVPDDETISQHCEDAFTELGNVLFGSLLVSIHENFDLTTFQDLPRLVSLDRNQAALKNKLSRGTREGDVLLGIEVDCAPEGNEFKTWLVFLPLSSGVRSFLERQTARRPAGPAPTSGP